MQSKRKEKNFSESSLQVDEKMFTRASRFVAKWNSNGISTFSLRSAFCMQCTADSLARTIYTFSFTLMASTPD